MPALEVSTAIQKAVLWPFTPGYDRFGQQIVGEPVEINVRWKTSRRTVTDPRGNTVTLNAEADVFQEVEPGSRMWLGTLDQWNQISSNPATVNEELCQVMTFDSIPDIKGRLAYMKVGLMKFHDTNQNQ